MNKTNVVIVDSIAFRGGSKVATENIINELDASLFNVLVLSNDLDSWRCLNVTLRPLYLPNFLATVVTGSLYFLRHIILVLNILYYRVMLGRVDVWLGASGPGVDLSVYLAKLLLGGNVIQLIHGRVAKSRTIGRCLTYADKVFYLESARDSLESALDTIMARSEFTESKYLSFVNGLSEQAWPRRTHATGLKVFWCASLLKWKGLDVLVTALNLRSQASVIDAHICYIRPKDTALPVSTAPIAIPGVTWHESPENLDEIRAMCNVFVSTSQNEPFGLSILEALAAGLCVLLPKDGAFWDSVLVDGVNCIKYSPGNTAELASILNELISKEEKVRAIGRAGCCEARRYRSKICYESIVSSLC